MDQDLVVFGNGQMASMLYFYFTNDSPYRVVAFTVNREHIREGSLLGLPVIPFEDLERSHPPEQVTMSIPISYRAINQLRATKYEEAKARGYRLINYISSKAVTWPGLVIGDNCIILEGAIIQPFSEIGNDVFVGCGSLIAHHSSVEDHCFIAPAAVVLGYVRIGPYCIVGANATVRDGVSVARECVIGAGITISHDTKPQEVYIGDRAQPSKKGSHELRQWITWGR